MSHFPDNAHVEALVEWLSRPESYAERPARVSLVETHISWVFLTNRYAYKLKKPVHFDFLDFAQPDARRHACLEEVRLNRRLAEDVYLGVVSVGCNGRGRFCWDPPANPLDWLVKMRRLDQTRALDRCLKEGILERDDVDQVARKLAHFYQELPPIMLQTDTYRQQLVRLIEDNLHELMSPEHRLDPLRVRAVHSAQFRILALHPEWFDQRVRNGRIVEGHGDLRPEHIYLMHSPVIIDCIEFRKDFRQLDALDELSFLTMECRLLKAEWVGQAIVQVYSRATGDPAPRCLAAFYSSYRACVRAKVCALRAQQQVPAQGEVAEQKSQQYLQLAQEYSAQLGGPRLIVVRGLTGTGKSTLAGKLAEILRSELLQTDALRRELHGVSSTPVAYGHGQYRPEKRQEVYQQMFQRARALLIHGSTVILDGTFLTHELRARAREVAESCKTGAAFVHVDCPPSIAMQRIERRGSHHRRLHHSSEEVYRRQMAEQEPDPSGADVLRVDSRESLPTMTDAVCRFLAERIEGECDE